MNSYIWLLIAFVAFGAEVATPSAEAVAPSAQGQPAA